MTAKKKINSRRKGHSFERQVAAHLRDCGFDEAKRGLSQSRGEGCDVDGTPYWIECKRGKKVDIRAAILQARLGAANDKLHRPWVVVGKDDGDQPFVVMSFEHFLHMAQVLRIVRKFTDRADLGADLSADHERAG